MLKSLHYQPRYRERSAYACLYVITVFVLLLVAPRTASAQLTFTLSNPVQSAPAGSFLTFSGTLTNTGADELFLNSISFNLFDEATLYLTGDDITFLNNVPLSLAADGGSYTGAIFGIDISSAAPEGSYFGLATLQGGLDSGATDDLATEQFQVIVTAPPSTTAPEPGGLLLLLPLLPIFHRYRRSSV